MAIRKADLKQRVISCINKLSDRDTFAMATDELETIARDLPQDSISSFISCISTTESDKAPVRRQCVRLLALLSESHGNALSPLLSKMLSFIIKRLRDSDSAVRSACVEAIFAMATKITKSPFSAISKPLFDSLTHEQDHNSQIGSALCLAAAIEASPAPEPVQLTKILPKLLKLGKSESFKAKPALLSLIGNVIEAGGGSNQGVLINLVRCLVDYLRSSDWAIRKAAAEALGKIASRNGDMVVELRSTCLSSLQSRRFDKVKIVRETMTRTLDLWQDIPCASTLSPSSFHSESPPEDCKVKNSLKKGSAPISPNKGSPPWEVEYTHSNTPEDDVNINISHFLKEAEDISRKMETKRALRFTESSQSNTRFSLLENDQCSCGGEERRKRKEDFSSIHKQLAQIQCHQSTILDLLQKFIGSCQSGMSSLETRVRFLELTLDELSRDLAVSNGRISCCKFPGSEFLSSKFGKKSEGALRATARGS